MNSKRQRHEIQKEISNVSGSIADLEERSATFQVQADHLAHRLSGLEQKIKARDWTLSGQRPKGCSETVKEATEMRSQLYAERTESARELSELQRQLAPMNRQLAELRCDLATLEQYAITAESIQPEINAAAAALVKFERKKKVVQDALAKYEKQLKEIAKSEHDESDAADSLNDARAKFYLAAPSEAATAECAIGEAATILNRCHDQALRAIAARPMVLVCIGEAEKELNRIDEQIEYQQTLLEGLCSKQKKIVALDQWAGLMVEARKGLHSLLEADRTVGRSLIEALRNEGLKEFDKTGRLTRPSWLQTSASGLREI